ncbi:TraM recognition domain-containing protein [Nocardia sp. 2]|uniref:TraM recognition domain-containing protein n=1 Tax=Nocardia acididurans TaxID=2802282 RepID=A0ABS1MJS6_9NOCA|nr:type IV secretory system conjugative DNA transfer family protein [Nocardia acididurans]MBL1080295.1 TraM recognition domain-containing protein [Nocardia acididurans]
MTTRRAAPAGRITGDMVVIATAAVVTTVVGVGYCAWWASMAALGSVGANPWQQFQAPDTWPVLAVAAVGLAESLLIVAGALVTAKMVRRHEVTRRARVMAGPHRLREVSGAGARAKARRLRPDADTLTACDIGIELGRTVIGGQPVYMSWEDEGVCFGGPRTGKTASLAITALCAAPGPVIATSNKRDLHDHCRGVRETYGRVWVSDLQGRCGHPAQPWWWDILAGLDTLPAARRLAGYFQAATTVPDARADNYFEGGALELLALNLLAAAVGGGDIMHAYGWLSAEDTPVPARLLEQAGQQIAAIKLRTAQGLNSRQRDGLYDMARRMLAVLSDPSWAATVMPPARKHFDGDTTALGAWDPTHDLPQFDPRAFVTSRDGLFLMSLEGPDSATALVTALVGRILDHALAVASRSPAGRLPVPLVGVLDEAANVCRLKELPYLYSHLGSQGVVLVTFLQSPAQASEVWTANQLEQLVSASNAHIYAGGVRDTKYLQGLCDQIGDHDVARWSDSHGRGGSSRSQSWSTERTLPVSLLAELPKDLALVLTTGNPPVLVRKVPWHATRYAEAIRASLARYEPTSLRKERIRS